MKVVTRFNIAPDTTTVDTDRKVADCPTTCFGGPVSGRPGSMDPRQERQHLSRNLSRHEAAQSRQHRAADGREVIDLAKGAEDLPDRIDLDDRNLPDLRRVQPGRRLRFRHCHRLEPHRGSRHVHARLRYRHERSRRFAPRLGARSAESILRPRLAHAQAGGLRHDRYPHVARPDDEKAHRDFHRRQGEAQPASPAG